MMTLIGFYNWKMGHVFVVKDGRCWQRAWDEEKRRWFIPSQRICPCCTKGTKVLDRMIELGLTHFNDGTNPPTEEEWNQIANHIPPRPRG